MKALCWLILLNLLCHFARGAGYEKNGLWGAKAASLGGIGSLEQGRPESLFFNPAGVAGSTYHWHGHVGFSPNQSQLSGPIDNTNRVQYSENNQSLVPGFIMAYHFSPQAAIAVGKYGVGGGKVEYNNVNFQGFNNPLNLKTDIQFAETSVGISYRVNRRFSVGASWRLIEYEASLTWPSRAYDGFVLAAPRLENLKGSDPANYRLGALMNWSRNHRSSIVYRSSALINAQGQTSGGVAATPVTDLGLDPGSASFDVLLPQSVTLGHRLRVSKNNKAFAEYSWTEYSQVSSLNLQTSSALVGNQSRALEWYDQHLVRFGLENTYLGLPLRAGFAWTSPVTNIDYPSALSNPPADVYSISGGIGFNKKFGGLACRFDVGADYNFSGAEAGTAPAGDTNGDYRQGTYNLSVLALHLSAGVLF